jgi:predicted enzyme related to lactoylglutathione lyase
MAMTETTVRGKFLWHTLLTADAETAAEFYDEIVGWKTQRVPHDPDYLLLTLPSGMLAGIRQFPAEESIAPPAQWLPYIGTPDIRGTIEQCLTLGGSVQKEVTAIPNTGEVAVLADPQGAAFAVYTPSAATDGQESAAGLSEFSWHELATTELTAAFDFYQKLFSWDEIATHDMGSMGSYLIFGRNGRQLGGMFKVMGDDPVPPNWLSYVRVADIDKAAAKVKAGGGQITNGPMEVPGGDWIAQCIDPQGAPFAVHAPQEAVEAKPIATSTAESPDAEYQEFAVTLVMERDSSFLPPARKTAKRKATAAATPPVKRAKPEKAAPKKTKRPAIKSRSAPASKKATKTAKRAVGKVGKKASKRADKQAKPAPRKSAARTPAKAKKTTKRKK